MFNPALWGEVAGGVQHGSIRGVSRAVVVREAGYAGSGGRALLPRPLITSDISPQVVLKMANELKTLKKDQRHLIGLWIS